MPPETAAMNGYSKSFPTPRTLIAVVVAGPLIASVHAAVPAEASEAKSMEALAEQVFSGMDQDADGQVTSGGHTASKGSGFVGDFSLIDLNGDGSVAQPEFLHAMKAHHGQAHGIGKGHEV